MMKLIQVTLRNFL